MDLHALQHRNAKRALVDDQEHECREKAERLGLGPVHAERDEAARAGAVVGKESWSRVLAAAESKECAGVMFWDLSRFSRDFFEGLADLGRLKAAGVKIADTKMGLIDLNSQAGQIYIAVGLSGAQQETKDRFDASPKITLASLRGRI